MFDGQSSLEALLPKKAFVNISGTPLNQNPGSWVLSQPIAAAAHSANSNVRFIRRILPILAVYLMCA
jgi:hypothetical protein